MSIKLDLVVRQTGCTKTGAVMIGSKKTDLNGGSNSSGRLH